MSQVEVVNVVGSGAIGAEIDLEALSVDLAADTNYTPETHTGMHIRLENGGLITLYRTGSYHIVGVDSVDSLKRARDDFFSLLRDVGVEISVDDDPFSVRNIVTTTDLEQTVNLNALAIGFGLENVEYEPEQFPGLVYRPKERESAVLIFGSGKMVITGVETVEEVEDVRGLVEEKVQNILG